MARTFVGPLCRYFAGERGEPVTFVQGVEQWRADLQEALGARMKPTLAWTEDPEEPARRIDLGPGGWIALRLFAFYADRSDLDLPDAVPALLELDREFRTALDAKFERSKYGNLLSARLWLPQDFPITARVALPDGDAIDLGSLPVLVDQLRWLNQRTFQADEEQVAAWRDADADLGGPLLAAAQRGFAGLWAAAHDAKARHLPLLVDEV